MFTCQPLLGCCESEVSLALVEIADTEREIYNID